MKKIILITSAMIGLLLTGNTLSAQLSWTWVKQVGDVSDEAGLGVASDSLGNICTVGVFYDNSLTIGTNTLTNMGPGHEDIFVVKYDAGGNVLWAKGIGGPGDEFSKSITTDKNGNIYVAGHFDSLTLNLGSVTFTNAGREDLFLAKYDPNGNLLWAKSAGGPGIEDAGGICVDGSGNVYITGTFGSAALTIGTYTLNNTGGFNILTAKFDANGNVLWAKSAAGVGGGHSVGDAVSVDGSGNLYVAADYDGTSFTFGASVLSNSGVSDAALVLKYDASGNPLWAKGSGGDGDFPVGIVADAAGNTYVAGWTNGPAFTIGANTFTVSGVDLFILKFDASGNVLWAKCIGGIGGEEANSIAMDAAGSIYVTGDFSSPSVSFGSIVLTRMGGSDAFVAKYDASGNALWATSVYGNQVTGNGICTGPGGDAYVAGYYYSGAATFGSVTLNNAGNNDGFVAKLSTAPLGIMENSLSNSAIIYPNPFTAEATIRLDKNVNHAAIRIYNVSGRLVGEVKDFNGTDYILSRGGLEAGMYFLQVTDGDRVFASGKITVVN